MNAGWSPFWRFEEALTRHYLRTDGGFGSTTLSFMDVSPPQLARALRRPAAEGETVLDEFVGLFGNLNLRHSLGDGITLRPPQGLEGPGWFNYLVFSCHIASVSPDRASSGQFRERLKEILGLPNRIETLSGVASLWERTVEWCERGRAAGKPLRRIDLPPIVRNMSQIGYSVGIVFPSRHDLNRMERLFGALASKLPLRADDVILAVRQQLNSHHWSQGFQRAFEDFDTRWRGGEKLLADHPFWLGIQGLRPPVAKSTEGGATFHIELSTDIDGNVAYSLRTDVRAILAKVAAGAIVGKDIPSVNVALDEILELLATRPAEIPQSLIQSHAEGVIPFDEAEWGLWRASRTPLGGKIRLLVRADILKRHGYSISQRDGWELLPPVARSEADAILRSVRGRAAVRSDVVGLRFVGGIKIDRSYLGRPAYLPSLLATPGCSATVVPFGRDQAELEASIEGDVISLRSEGALDGVWRIAVAERGIVRAEPSLNFEPNALELAIQPPDVLAKGWRADEPLLIGSSAQSVKLQGSHAATSDAPAPLLDLLEALYAGGARGWAEQDIVPLVERILPPRLVVWDVLQLLADSGWLEARVSREWRARRWYLRPASLLSYPDEGMVLLDGAAPERARRRFREAVDTLDGNVEMRACPGTWFVPALVARVRDAERLADALGLDLRPAEATLPVRLSPVRFEDTLFTTDRRIEGSSWSWSRKRFVKYRGDSLRGVRIERMATAKPNASDVYRVSTEGEVKALLDGRSASILLAHMLAEEPLFAYHQRDAFIERVAHNGSLPPQIARYLRVGHGCGPAMASNTEFGWRYRFPCGPQEGQLLGRWLGAAFVTDRGDEPDLLRSLVMMRARGAAGRTVAANCWKGG
jgi:hypothetical protein